MYYITSSLLYGITAGISEGYRVDYEQGGKINANKQQLSARWHDWKLVSTPFIVGTGYTVALHTDFNFGKTIVGLYTSAVIAWISHDIAYNATRRLDWFRKGNTPAVTEVEFPVKLAALGSVILLEFLFDK